MPNIAIIFFILIAVSFVYVIIYSLIHAVFLRVVAKGMYDIRTSYSNAFVTFLKPGLIIAFIGMMIGFAVGNNGTGKSSLNMIIGFLLILGFLFESAFVSTRLVMTFRRAFLALLTTKIILLVVVAMPAYFIIKYVTVEENTLSIKQVNTIVPNQTQLDKQPNEAAREILFTENQEQKQEYISNKPTPLVEETVNDLGGKNKPEPITPPSHAIEIDDSIYDSALKLYISHNGDEAKIRTALTEQLNVRTDWDDEKINLNVNTALQLVNNSISAYGIDDELATISQIISEREALRFYQNSFTGRWCDNKSLRENISVYFLLEILADERGIINAKFYDGGPFTERYQVKFSDKGNLVLYYDSAGGSISFNRRRDTDEFRNMELICRQKEYATVKLIAPDKMELTTYTNSCSLMPSNTKIILRKIKEDESCQWYGD